MSQPFGPLVLQDFSYKYIDLKIIQMYICVAPSSPPHPLFQPRFPIGMICGYIPGVEINIFNLLAHWTSAI